MVSLKRWPLIIGGAAVLAGGSAATAAAMSSSGSHNHAVPTASVTANAQKAVASVPASNKDTLFHDPTYVVRFGGASEQQIQDFQYNLDLRTIVRSQVLYGTLRLMKVGLRPDTPATRSEFEAKVHSSGLVTSVEACPCANVP